MRAGIGSKNKGSRFERAVCRDLSLWVSGGQREDVFWRSAMSGGRATIGLRRGASRGAQAGDVSAVVAIGERLLNHVVVECKHYKELDLFSGLASDSGKLYRFWHELRAYATKFGKQPMLVARQNLMPTVCLLPEASSFVLFRLTGDHVTAVLPRWNCHLFLFECFTREAQVPEADLRLVPRRVTLAWRTV